MQMQTLYNDTMRTWLSWIVTILFLLSLTTEISAKKTVANALSPRNLSLDTQLAVKVGRSKKIKCNLTLEQSESTNYSQNTFDVLWRWKPQTNKEWKTLKNTKSIRISPRRKDASNNEGTPISTLTLLNTSVNMSGTYGCFLKDANKPLRQTQLIIGYPPVPPTELDCKTNGFLTKMNCTWNIGRPTHLNTTYQLFYKIKPSFSTVLSRSAMGENSQVHTTNCSLDPPNSARKTSNIGNIFCVIELSDNENSFEEGYLKLNLQVQAANALGLYNSSVVSENPVRIVKPDPPTDLKISDYDSTAVNDKSSSSLRVTWKAPEANFLLTPFSYKVRYRPSLSDTTWDEIRIDNTTGVLTHLDSDTSYDVQVATLISSETYFGGFPSEWSEKKSYRTELQIPSTPFYFLAINATLVYKEVWNINVEWQLYKRKQLGFYYYIIYSISNKEHKLPDFPYRTNTATFTVNGSEELIISGKSCNKRGCSEFSNEIIQLDTVVPPVQNVKLSVYQSGYNVTWQPTKHHISKNQFCNVRVCSSVRQFNSVPTFFNSNEEPAIITFNSEFNREFSSVCERDSIQDVELPCSAASYFIPRNDISVSPCFQNNVVVLSVRKSGIQKIMTLSSPSIAFTLSNPVKPTKGRFSAEDVSSEGSCKIRTNWKWTESLCRNTSDHLSLSVVYKPVSGAGCLQNKICPKDDLHFTPISNCSQDVTSYDVTPEVCGGTTYNFGLGYCCPSRDDSNSLCFAAYSNKSTLSTPIGESYSDDKNNTAITIIGILISLTALVVFFIIAHVNRKRIKKAVRRAIWPRLPEPSILIVNGINVQAENFENADTYNNPLYRKQRQSDNISCNEMPDNIHEEENVRENQSKDSQYKQTNKSDQVLVKDDRGVLANDGKQTNTAAHNSDETDSSALKFRNNEDLSPLGTDHTPYSLITPLRSLLSTRSDTSDFDEYATTVSAAQFTSWRAILYPRSIERQNGNNSNSGRITRPFSYSGSSGSGLTEMDGYVRYCEQNKQDQSRTETSQSRNFFSSLNRKKLPTVTYSKLAVDYCGGPKFVDIPVTSKYSKEDSSINHNGQMSNNRLLLENYSRFNGESRQFRGESWYDGYSSYKAPLLADDKKQNEEEDAEIPTSPSDLTDYIESVQSYVTCGNSTDETQTHKASTDLTEHDTFEDFLKNLRKTSFDISNDETDDPSTSIIKDYATMQQELSSNDEDFKGSGLPSEEIEESPPSYICSKENYVSLNEALHPNERNSHSHWNEPSIFNDDLSSSSNMLNFTQDDDWDNNGTLNLGEMTQFIDSSLNPRTAESQSNDEVVDDYITTAEAAVRK